MHDNLDEAADQVISALEVAVDDLESLRSGAATARADAKKVEARALLDARDLGFKSREERDAYATLAAADLEAAADIAERVYRDKNTYIRVLQSQLELIRSRMATDRSMRV